MRQRKQRRTKSTFRYPDTVTVKDIAGAAPTDGTSTPIGEPDFFADFDKPMIKRPTPPISRASTPGIARVPSPFLKAENPNGGIDRAPSPLAGGEKTAPPAASRTTSSAALRKSAVGAGPRKTSVLGAKKTKLGAKKVTGDVIDFDAAEKKAKEEAERIEKLGYDPEAEEVAVKSITTSKASEPTLASPTPISPNRGGFGATKRTDSDVERLGMGVQRLGFGQVGGNKAAQPVAKKMGFGSVGGTKIAQEGNTSLCFISLQLHANTSLTDDSEKYARDKFGAQKGISSDEFFGKGAFDPSAQSEAKTRLKNFDGATSISSNAYFGRPEDEPGQGDMGGDYGDLETAAKDFVRKFGVTAGDDLENLTQVLGEGATKLQGAIRSYLNS